MYFAVSVDHRVKMEETRIIDKYVEFAKEKKVEHVDNGYSNYSWCN